MTKHINIKVDGHVQGVGYRYHARAVAFRLGLRGYIKNTPDGGVFIEAEGEPEMLNSFVKWCEQCPIHAHVENVTVTRGEVKDYSAFEIIK